MNDSATFASRPQPPAGPSSGDLRGCCTTLPGTPHIPGCPVTVHDVTVLAQAAGFADVVFEEADENGVLYFAAAIDTTAGTLYVGSQDAGFSHGGFADEIAAGGPTLSAALANVVAAFRESST
jgi:hypothetical protein